MKVCFLANELSLQGGWGRYAVNLLKQLSAQNIDCYVLLSSQAKENALPQIENYKILPPLFTSRINKFFTLVKNYTKIQKLIQKSDIIHSLVEPYGSIAYLTKGNKPLIITLHGTYAVNPLRKFYLSSFYNKVYRSAKKLICVSSFTQKEILKKIQLENTLVINNGVNYKKFQTTQSINQKNKTIISVGTLVSRKGYHISIPAIAEVSQEYPNLKYYIIGNQQNSSYFKQLKELVNKYNLEKNIVFLEGISDADLVKIYHQADLFLLTPINLAGYKFEGFGQVYLEAGACSKPAIGTTGCGVEDAIQDGYNGLLVPQNNIPATSQAIKKILSNQNLAQRLGQNGQKLARQSDWSYVFKKYQVIYESIVN